jgi:hypothetical protein
MERTSTWSIHYSLIIFVTHQQRHGKYEKATVEVEGSTKNQNIHVVLEERGSSDKRQSSKT